MVLFRNQYLFIYYVFFHIFQSEQTKTRISLKEKNYIEYIAWKLVIDL